MSSEQPVPWYHPDSWLTELFEPKKKTFIIASLVVFVLPVILHILHLLLLKLTGTKKAQKSGFFLLGPSGAGTTSLLASLEGNSIPTRRTRAFVTSKIPLSEPSASSEKPQTTTVFVPPGIGKYRVQVLCRLALALGLKPQSAAASSAAARASEPTGGDDRAVSASWPKSHSVAGIVFAVDATQMTSAGPAQDAAEYLHDILLLLQWQAETGATVPPLLITANKTELLSASSVDAVWTRLEAEVEKVRQSRQREAQTMGAAAALDTDDENPLDEFFRLGYFKGALETHSEFLFDRLREYGILVDSTESTSKSDKPGVAGVRSWIQKRA